MAGAREPVDRSVDVLVWLAMHPWPPWSVRPVGRKLNASSTTIHRVFGIFENRSLLEKDGTGGYVPGLQLYRIGHGVTGQISPVRALRPHLEDLLRACGETVLLGAYDAGRGEMMYLDMAQSPHPVRYVLPLVEWMPIHAGATGLAIFASLPASERRSIVARWLWPPTDRTLLSQEQLERAVARVHRTGWIATWGQRQVGAVGIAAPVFDSVGDVFGDVCVTIPEQRFDEARLSELGSRVLDTSRAVTSQLRRMGYRRGLADRPLRSPPARSCR